MKIFNPLDHIQMNSESSELESNSSVCNEKPGICPKCMAPMDTKSIPTPQGGLEDVFWCDPCKVATPKPLEDAS